MNLQEKLKNLEQHNQALLAINFYNYETLKAVVRAIRQCNQQVILQASESTVRYLGAEPAAAMARSVLQDEAVEGWLHLDHASDMDVLERCLEAGFDSVMIDASQFPLEKNIEITRQAVEKARYYGVNVEAELGYIAKLGQSQQKLEFTQPQQARTFVDQTQVDCLAVAIGSAHGFYQQQPELRIDLLEEIHQAVGAHLVLHGSSGIPDEQIQSAVKHGIRKINLATEIKDTFMNTLKEVLQQTDEIDLRKVFPKAMESVVDLVLSKYGVLDKVNL